MSIKPLLSAIVVASLLFGFSSRSAAEETPSTYSLQDLLVTPTRIVFEGNMRTAELALVNRSDKVRSYTISFVQCVMTEEGEIRELDPSAKQAMSGRFADSYVRFTPRRVVLEPRQVQMVRMLLRKPSDLADGEYRSHLNFRLVPSAEDAVKPDSVSRGISIKLVPIYGVMIPVIVRQGSLGASVRLNGMKVLKTEDPAKPCLSLIMEREGGSSVYGDLEALWKAPGGKAESIGMIRGVAVYTPNSRRTISVPLLLPKGVALRGGQLSVRYIDHESGAEKIFSESQLDLP